VTVDHYARAGRRWADGASLVYAPIAAHLVDRSPHPLAGRRVLDAGAGTGAASAALVARGALPVAMDLSLDMLAQDAARRPPCAVADLRSLPLADSTVDDVVAAFVLNHLAEPVRGIAELARVTVPGGALLATVYSNASRSAVRDRVDEVARAAGWQVPAWYVEAKAQTVPLLGSAEAMAAAAETAGLTDISVEEGPVDVGVTEPEQLVDYRFGQAHFAAWLDEIGPEAGGEIRRRAADAIRPIMEPYRPVVVFLRAVVGSGGAEHLGAAPGGAASGDQHAAVGKEHRGVCGAGREHARLRRPPPGRGDVALHGGQRAVSVAHPAGHQNGITVHEDRGV
jgi:ubiquinone/menaquinone biosynthesis C-methylase UbiE